jgi:hypothetical protein
MGNRPEGIIQKLEGEIEREGREEGGRRLGRYM